MTADGLDASGRPTALRSVDLSRLFHPKVVAVVGASDSEGRPNTGVWRRLWAWGVERGVAVYPVNPSRAMVDGVACYPSLAEVPGEIDVAAILVGDAAGALAEAVARGVRFAVVFAAGFAEQGEAGRAAQAELAGILEGGVTRLLGPNTNLNAFESFRGDLPGRAVALITQSGHQGRPLFQAQELGIRVSHWAPTGNEVDLEVADFVAWFADQPDTGAIAAYVEGFKDGRSLVLAADHALRAGVPIVCVKVGRSELGASMAASHTGKLTGSDKVTSAVLRQYGVTRVDGLDEVIDTTQLMARHPNGPVGPGGDGVVIYSISGGTGAHMADLCAAAGLRLPTLSEDLQGRLHQWIPEQLRVSNPVDNGGHPVGDERGRKILDALVADPDVGVIICPITGAFPPMSDRLAQDLADVAEATDKPICVIWGSPTGLEDAYRHTLLGSPKLAVFRTFTNCVGAIRAWLDWHHHHNTYQSPFEHPPRRPSPAAKTARSLLQDRTALSEHQAKEILAAYGIPITDERIVTSAAAAVRAAREVGAGNPVVMKASGAHLSHKTELGGIRLDVRGTAATRHAYAELAAISGGEVLVSQTARTGVEVVVGISQDPVFGPVVMAGLGGVLIEVLEDVTFRVPPFDTHEAHRMLDELRGRALLAGVRGRPPADINALADTIVRVQHIALDLANEINELDINPLLVQPQGQGVIALDALVVPRP